MNSRPSATSEAPRSWAGVTFPRRTIVRAMAGPAIVLVLAALTIRFASFPMSASWVIPSALPRTYQMLDELPRTLASLDHPAVVLGTSQVTFGHVTDAFDRAYAATSGQPVQSVNLGVP